MTDEEYTPKRIISEVDYDNYLLMLHRELANLKIIENTDPPSPFRKFLLQEEDIKIVINDTNDLYYCIRYFVDQIQNDEIKHAIIGDPYTLGYKHDVLDKMTGDFNLPVSFVKNKDWIIALINITDSESIIIEDSTIRVRKK
jgi:hypothetical protein